MSTGRILVTRDIVRGSFRNQVNSLEGRLDGMVVKRGTIVPMTHENPLIKDSSEGSFPKERGNSLGAIVN